MCIRDSYEAEQKELKERAAAIRAELSKAQEATVNAEKFMNVVQMCIRDSIDGGRYIEKIFPQLGIRFIAINDAYDSLTGDPQSDSFVTVSYTHLGSR